ncbi:MAG: gamma carbonic anhydrase family protein [Rhodothermales bacterium]|nr:gamma carbonic anhydrase family protein [Rhodothermales bacterium]MCA0268967.1 gamma carbonic anhydrase family protein [Bacteroidota bacterium]
MLLPFLGRLPRLAASCFVADNATVVGDVTMGECGSIWFQAVVRGDVHRIRIGDRTNVQDGAILHVTNRTAPLTVGSDVTVGHGAILHGCTVHDRVLVGMGAVVMDHAVIGEDCLIGARALVTERTVVPPRSLVIGSPAKVVRSLTDDEVARIQKNADGYVRYSRIYLGIEVPETNPFYDAED